MKFCFTTTAQHSEEATLLKDRFQNARTIPGTQKLHSFKPISRNCIEVREFSSSSTTRAYITEYSAHSENNVDLISGYITAEYDGFWWLGCVVKMKQESRLVKVNFLHPHGPAPSFFFPEREDIFEIDVADVLKSAAPLTTTGRTFTL